MGIEYGEAVFTVASCIPPGLVLTYADIAEILEAGGPRPVGLAMSQAGCTVPWWRVVRAGGLPPQNLCAEAKVHYLAEGTALRGMPSAAGAGHYRVDLATARWEPDDGAETILDGIRTQLAQTNSATGIGPGRRRTPRMSVPRDGLQR